MSQQAGIKRYISGAVAIENRKYVGVAEHINGSEEAVRQADGNQAVSKVFSILL